MRDALDWIEQEKPLEVRPLKTTRTQLQIVLAVEDTRLNPYLIPTDVYICPSEAMVRLRKAATR